MHECTECILVVSVNSCGEILFQPVWNPQSAGGYSTVADRTYYRNVVGRVVGASHCPALLGTHKRYL